MPHSVAVAMRVGVDVVVVADVADSLVRHGEGYLSRVYTPAEVADSRSAGALDPARLAARFAAKEATVKVLDAQVPWSSIEVSGGEAAQVRLSLTGAAATAAEAGGMHDLRLSVTHGAGLASAVVIAEIG